MAAAVSMAAEGFMAAEASAAVALVECMAQLVRLAFGAEFLWAILEYALL